MLAGLASPSASGVTGVYCVRVTRLGHRRPRVPHPSVQVVHADQMPACSYFLNPDPKVCMQVMGAPIAGSDLRAQILTGGGLRLKNLQPRIRSRRLQMLFWATGTERRGLVSLEAKKQKVCAP